MQSCIRSVHTQHLGRTLRTRRTAERFGTSFAVPEQSLARKEESEDASVVPPVPETLEDTGLARVVLQQLILKMLYSRGDMLGRELSEALGLKFSLIEGIIDFSNTSTSFRPRSRSGWATARCCSR